MSIEVVGDTAYELICGANSPLTDGEADGLVAEYDKVGLRYKKGVWDGQNCVMTKAPEAEFKRFKAELSGCWESIKERVGHGLLISSNNSYQPGRTNFNPEADWEDMVAFIDANY